MDLGSVQNPFHCPNSPVRLGVLAWVLSIFQIDLFKNYSYSMGLCAKKKNLNLKKILRSNNKKT